MKTAHIAALYIQGILAILGSIIVAALVFVCIQLTKTNESFTKTNENLIKTHDLIQKVYPEDEDERTDIAMLNELIDIRRSLTSINQSIDSSKRSASNRYEHIEETIKSIEKINNNLYKIDETVKTHSVGINTALNNIDNTMKYFEEYSKLIKKYLMPPIMTIEPIQSK